MFIRHERKCKMSLEEFVRNRKKLPNFGIVRDTLPDISKIMESGKECSYFYFGDEQRKMAGEQLENELKSSVHGAIIKSSMYHGKLL